MEDTSATTVVIFGSGSITSVEPGDPVLPESHALSQNYPNPFNPSTTISYSVESPAAVELRIYDILGREARTLLNENKKAGEYSIVWDGTDNFASGHYFYQLKTGEFQSTRRMILLK